MKISLITDKQPFLKEWASFTPQLFEVECGGKISVFTFFMKTQKELAENWEIIISSVAAHYQAELVNTYQEYERWNIYLLFLIEGKVDVHLKYRIENDKFSSRKIIQEEWKQGFEEDKIKTLISERILNTDLSSCLEDIEPSKENYKSDSEIYNKIVRYKSECTKSGKEEYENLYEDIVKLIRNEVQED